MKYATQEELAEYLDIDVTELPDDVERILERASELVDYFARGKISESNELDAAKLATMAQYEWWAESGDELGITNQYDSVKIGKFSISGGEDIPVLAPRAKQALFLEGLLYGGVDIK